MIWTLRVVSESKKKSKDSKNGQSLFELLAGLSVLIPVALLTLDLSLFVAASQTNASVCRDAARAAASGNPDYAEARALAALESGLIYLPCTSFRLSSQPQLAIKSRPVSLMDPLEKVPVNPGGAVQGEVLVSTEAEVHPIIFNYFWAGKDPVRFSCQQSCPITYTEPARSHKTSLASKVENQN